MQECKKKLKIKIEKRRESGEKEFNGKREEVRDDEKRVSTGL